MSNPGKTPIEVTGKKPICISFSSAVSAKTSIALMGAMAGAVNDGFDEIHFFLSTPGGTVHEGIAIYNTIRSLPVPVRSYNLGNVNSIGNVLFQAGEKRICAKNSSFMFHGVGVDVQKARFELKQLNETLSAIRNDQSLIASIMIRHTKLTEKEIEGLFLAMAHMSADKAVERGIADEVRDIHLPKGIPISQLIFQ